MSETVVTVTTNGETITVADTATETISVAGNSGPQGETGPQGDPGPQGIQGDKGDTGDTGPAADTSALLVKANNLSDLTSASTARTNLGLGTMATAAASDYLSKAGNLGGIADPAAARTNLGLGTMATQASSAYAALAGATFAGDVSVGAGSAAVDSLLTINGGTNTGKGGAIAFKRGGSTKGYLGTRSFVIGGSTDDISLISYADLTLGIGSRILMAMSSSANTLNAYSSIAIPVVAKGFSAQTANLQEWQNSSGTALASISAAGLGTFAGVTSTAGTFTSAVPALSVTGTMPTTGGTFVYGSDHVITSAGSAAHSQIALHSNLAAGYTGNRYTMGAWFENNAAGTGTSAWGANYANYGALSQVTATTTGHNVGQLGYASGGVLNIGFMGQAPTNKNSGVNVGVVGFGLNGGTSPTQVGGYFALTNGAAAPTLTSAALMADNVAQTSDIFVARDNGTPVFTVADGGALGFFGGSPVAKPTGVAVSAAAIHAALVTLNLIAA